MYLDYAATTTVDHLALDAIVVMLGLLQRKI